MSEHVEPVIPEKVQRAQQIVKDAGYDRSEYPIALSQFLTAEPKITGYQEFVKTLDNKICHFVSFICLPDSNGVSDLKNPDNWIIAGLKIPKRTFANFKPSPRRKASTATLDELLEKEPAISVSDFFIKMQARQFWNLRKGGVLGSPDPS